MRVREGVRESRCDADEACGIFRPESTYGAGEKTQQTEQLQGVPPQKHVGGVHVQVIRGVSAS